MIKNRKLKLILITVFFSLSSAYIFGQLTFQQGLDIFFNSIDSVDNGSNMYKNVIKKLNSKAFKKDLIALMNKSKDDVNFDYNLSKCKFIVIPTLKMDNEHFLDSLHTPIEVKIFQRNKYIGEYGTYINIKDINIRDVEKYSNTNALKIGTFDNIKDSGSQERYTGITLNEIAEKIKIINPDFIFSYKGWYHVYIYYKDRKFYCFDIRTLKSKQLTRKK